MKIADLFIGLGVKGDDQAGKAVNKVDAAMKELITSSLGAKIGIAGVVYAIKELMNKAETMGTSLTQMKALTGLNITTIQQWQYSMEQAGVSAEETAGSIKTIQKNIASMSLGSGTPGGIDVISKAVGGIDPKKMYEKGKGVFYLMEKMREFANTPIGKTAQGNEWLRNAGMTDSMIAGLRLGVVNAKNFKDAMKYALTEGEAGNLQKIQAQWGNLGKGIQHSIGVLDAKHGENLIANLTKITTTLTKFVDQLARFGEESHVFQVIDAAIEGWGIIFEQGNKFLESWNGPEDKNKKGGKEETFKEKAGNWFQGLLNYRSMMAGNQSVQDVVIDKSRIPSRNVTNNHVTHGDVNVVVKTDSDDPHHHGRIVAEQVNQKSINHANFTSPARKGGK